MISKNLAKMADGVDALTDQEVADLLATLGKEYVLERVGYAPSEEAYDAIEQRGRRILATALRLGAQVTPKAPVVPASQRWHGMDAVDIYSLYANTDSWVDQKGNRHLIAEMPTRYLRTVRRFIERSGPNHCLSASWHLPYPHMNGDIAQMTAEHEWQRIVDDLWEWAASHMRKAPLYRAVCAELRNRKRLVRTYKVRHWTDRDVPTYREAVPF